jgi:hypothetical protein
MPVLTEYQEQGFKNRQDYLSSLAVDFGVEESQVFALASALGSSEDFDGLVSHLDDMG